MTDTNNSTMTTAWNALVAAYREHLRGYKAAFDVLPDDADEAHAALHAGLKPLFDTVQAFPVQTAEQFVEKAAILSADFWDREVSFDALGRDVERLAGIGQ